MLRLGIVTGNPRRSARTALKGAAGEAELASLGFVGANVAVHGLLLVIVISHHLDGVFVASGGDQFVGPNYRLDGDRFSIMGALPESEESVVMVDVVVLVPVRVDVSGGYRVRAIRRLAVVIAGCEADATSRSADAVRGREDDVAILACDDAGAAIVFLDVVTVEHSHTGNAIKRCRARQDAWERHGQRNEERFHDEQGE